MTDNNIFSDNKALFHTFGCKLNFAETSSVAKLFADAGVRRVQTGEVPDIIVINTCSVTEMADKKCRQAIRAFNRKYPDAQIVVTGCYAQLKPQTVSALPGVVVVAGTDRKDELPRFLAEWRKRPDRQKAMTSVINSKDISNFVPACERGDRTRYFLKVQDGCDYWCSYCTIPKARGRSRSGTVAQMVQQARQVARQGGKEIVLTGVNIGDFGKGSDENFFDLIKALDAVEGISRYRISSIEPNLLTPEIIDFCSQSKRFMPHFHIPLQCGSDNVLKLMRRRYDTALFRSRIQDVRRLIPDAFIGIDLIVGARGETDEFFEESYEFCKSLDISRMHVFVYSERPGTRALELDGKVDAAVARKRTLRMLALSETKLAEFHQRYLGTVRTALLEHGHDGLCRTGFTDNYIKVQLTQSTQSDNCLVPVRLIKIADDGESVIAEIVK